MSNNDFYVSSVMYSRKNSFCGVILRPISTAVSSMIFRNGVESFRYLRNPKCSKNHDYKIITFILKELD